ncbi:hypothetical protein MJD09_02235, partial [bacterium]|nr:hypothetical protein [bacterium]
MSLKTRARLRNLFCLALLLQGCITPTLRDGDIGRDPISDPRGPVSPDTRRSEFFAALVVESLQT